MLIQELCIFADERLPQPPPPMYQQQSIRYLITLQMDGTMVGGKPQDLASPQDKATKRGLPLLAPHVKRTVGIRPKLLADTGGYVLGIPSEDSKADRVQEQHAQFVALVDQCRDATGEPTVGAVSAFLARLPAAPVPLPDDFDPSATITFEVGSELVRPIDLPAVRQFWADLNSADEGSDTHLLPCIGCGRLRPPLERHPIKIKGVPGGQILKDLVSANAAAFESYGLKASTIAPICQTCAEGYANALNFLLADPTTHLWMKEAAYAFWTRKPSTFSPVALISDPLGHPGEVNAVLTAHIRGAEAAVDLDPNLFFTVGLGASGARLVVSDWLDTTVGEAQRWMGRYFALQSLVEWDGSDGAAVPLFRLTGATVRDARKDDPPPIVGRSLIRLALAGTPLPMDLLYLAVRRNRAAQNVTRERAMLIKMVLLSQPNLPDGMETTMSELELENSTPAYLCGRLLATLDRIQYLATRNEETKKGVNAGIVDKFYGSASSAPASVFGTLMHGAQPHLSKLRRDKPGLYLRMDDALQEITRPLRAFPKTLSLEDQGLFALGFYHQRAAGWPSRQKDDVRNPSAQQGADEEQP